MADDNILRSYRSNDAARRSAASARDAGNSDPLAELARLIGQSDPFADMDRGQGSASASAAGSTYGRGPAFEAEPSRADAGTADWRKQAAAMAREQLRESTAAGQHYAEVESAVAAAKSLRASPDDHFGHSYAPEPAYDQSAYPQDSYADTAYADAAYADPAYTDTAEAAYGDGPHVDSYTDTPLEHRAQEFAAQPDAAPDNENYFFDGAPVTAEQVFYDDPPRARAASSVVTALIVFGCGILGTAGAYGYRTYYSGARPTDAPIISADKTPIKVVPASAAGGDGQSGKSAERVGGGGERMVARQEEPVALPDPSNPRVVLPAPYPAVPAPANPSPASNTSSNAATTVPPPAALPPAASNPAPASAVASEGTKKVHTIAIHPLDGDALAPITNVSTPPVSGSAPAAAAPRQAGRQASASSRNNGPLSLDPQGQTSTAVSSYQPVAQDRPRARPAAPTQLASASSTPASVPSGSGGYMVQISSQRSEADAQASIRGLQSKYPNQLGEREAMVSRVDLGAKGIYYRAMVGPFGNGGDAEQFCSSLKAAGGQCIVHKN